MNAPQQQNGAAQLHNGQMPQFPHPASLVPPEGNYNPMESPQVHRQYQQQQMAAAGEAEQPKPKRTDRIDPKQMPRPAELRFGEPLVKFHTRSGSLPPSTTSEYLVVDEGNCSPRFVRLTTNNIAADGELMDSTKLCVGAILQPLADLAPGEEEIPVIDYPEGPLRCQRCRAYVSSFFKFIESGAKFMCNLCGTTNAVPLNYQCNLDANGQRRDRLERYELHRGTVEFVAGPEFSLRPIQDPCYLLLLDVSYAAVVTGLVNLVIDTIRTTLDRLAENPRIRLGLVTYDSAVQFYSLKAGRDPSIMVVTDTEDVFVPCPPDEILVHVGQPEERELLESLLDLLSSIYDQSNYETRSEDKEECATGAALHAACSTLKQLGGKVLCFQSNLANCGMGKLVSRDKGDLYHTDKEKTLWVPQNDFYQRLSATAAESAVTVDLYICANSYVDVATMGSMVNVTGGQLFLYPGFNGRKDSEALQYDITQNLLRETGFDAVMVVRCSAGLKVAEYYGNYYYRRPHEMELPSIDCDKTFGIRLEYEGKLEDKSEACLQCALLYTTSKGQRRIRIHTISVPVTATMANIFRFSDLDTIINLSLKQAVKQFKGGGTSPQVAQGALVEACVESLFIYRKYCASPSSSGQLILPEPLKLLPLFTLGLIKNPLMQTGLPADQRAYLFSVICSMPTSVCVAFVVPRLFSLVNMPENACILGQDGRVHVPTSLTLNTESIHSDGLYLLDNGRCIYLWIGENLDPHVLSEVFAVDPMQARSQHLRVTATADPLSQASRVRLLIDELRKNKPAFENLQIVMQSHGGRVDTLDEKMFFSLMLEDGVEKGTKNPCQMSYVDFLCHIHKKIQRKFF